mmetsp:Transcript_31815/g.46805  ORF Transcript_31815/g.46805 Transcript_31815/m.46805 type:complete len:316 (-) Transcript_31815:92-1039(-)
MMFSFRSRKSSSSSWPLALAHPPKPKPKPKHQCMPPVGICALVALSLGCLPAIINVYLHNKTLHALDNRVKPVQTFIPIPTQDESKEVPFDVFWLHIQKTGTSFFNTIYLHFCPSVLSKNPALVNETMMDRTLLKSYPPQEFCNGTFANMPCPGCHHAYPKKNVEKYFYFTMFREPMERLRSAYSFGKHLSKLKNDSISFDTYLNEKHIPNCQLKMILGFGCAEFVDPQHLNISLALERIQAPNFFFGITDRWDESICLFHSMYGGSTQQFELKNNRKTKRVQAGTGYINRTFAESFFFDEVLKLFNVRVKKAGC